MSDIENEAPNPDARREVLAAAIDALPQEAAPAVAAPEPAAEAPKTTEKARDPATGKFAPKPAEAAPAPIEGAPEPAWKKPPQSWKADKHPVWEAMPDPAREYAWQREEEMRKGTEPLQTKAQIADQFQQAAEPYLPIMNQLGIQPIQAFKELAAADANLRTLPMDQRLPYAAQLLRGYGINLTMGQDGQVVASPSDPVVYTLQNQLTNVTNTLQSMQQQQEEVRSQEVQREITSFAADHPHFEQLQKAMSQLLQSGMAQTLGEAYEKASRLDPDIYAKIEAEKTASAAAEKTRIAQAAKAAAVSPRSSTPGAITAPKATDRRSTISELVDAVEGRF